MRSTQDCLLNETNRQEQQSVQLICRFWWRGLRPANEDALLRIFVMVLGTHMIDPKILAFSFMPAIQKGKPLTDHPGKTLFLQQCKNVTITVPESAILPKPGGRRATCSFGAFHSFSRQFSTNLEIPNARCAVSFLVVIR